MDSVAHLADDSDEDFSGMPALESKGNDTKASKKEEGYFTVRLTVRVAVKAHSFNW